MLGENAALRETTPAMVRSSLLISFEFVLSFLPRMKTLSGLNRSSLSLFGHMAISNRLFICRVDLDASLIPFDLLEINNQSLLQLRQTATQMYQYIYELVRTVQALAKESAKKDLTMQEMLRHIQIFNPSEIAIMSDVNRKLLDPTVNEMFQHLSRQLSDKNSELENLTRHVLNTQDPPKRIHELEAKLLELETKVKRTAELESTIVAQELALNEVQNELSSM